MERCDALSPPDCEPEDRKLSSTMTFCAGLDAVGRSIELISALHKGRTSTHSVNVDQQRDQRWRQIDEAVLQVNEGEFGRSRLRILPGSHGANIRLPRDDRSMVGNKSKKRTPEMMTPPSTWSLGPRNREDRGSAPGPTKLLHVKARSRGKPHVPRTATAACPSGLYRAARLMESVAGETRLTRKDASKRHASQTTPPCQLPSPRICDASRPSSACFPSLAPPPMRNPRCPISSLRHSK